METVTIALVGCGGIAGAHENGYQQLWRAGFRNFSIEAVCDIVLERAQFMAQRVESWQGTRPRVYSELETLLKKEPEIIACDINSLHRNHHHLAVQALSAGKNVLIEKPLGITIRACQVMIETAQQYGKILATAENYRRAPTERAIHWALRQGRIGQPRMLFWQDVGEHLGKWGWRDFKEEAGGGWVLDGGVHFTDLWRYHLGGEAETVYALCKAYEPYRYSNPETKTDPIEVTVEDSAFALIQFQGGVIVQWTTVKAGPGKGFSQRTLYGSEGCLDWGSGLHIKGINTSLPALVREFRSAIGEEEWERLFPRGITDTFATEILDFIEAVQTGKKPEVDGVEGMKDAAICFAVYESSEIGRPVTLEEVETGQLEVYQKSLNEQMGLS